MGDRLLHQEKLLILLQEYEKIDMYYGRLNEFNKYPDMQKEQISLAVWCGGGMVPSLYLFCCPLSVKLLKKGPFDANYWPTIHWRSMPKFRSLCKSVNTKRVSLFVLPTI